MKKKVILFASISVIVLIGIFLLVFHPQKLSEKSILESPLAAVESCKTLSNSQQDSCYLKIAEVLALNNTDIALQACLAIGTDTNDGDRKNCIEELANKQTEQLKAVEICNAMASDKNFREHCYGTITASTGNLNSDTQLLMCDSKTGMDKDNCYRGIAESFLLSNVSKNVEICNKISEKSLKDNCLNNIIGNPEIVQANPNLAASICGSLTLKSNCYNYVAQTLSGIDPKQGALICRMLSDNVQISNCYGSVWFSFSDVVVQNYDFTISLCNALTSKRDDCLRRASEAFMSTDRAKAEAICKLMSASSSSGCLQNIR
jgi:hypothetical protein